MALGRSGPPARGGSGGGGGSSGSSGSGYAARVLREMYGNSLPRAAVQLLRDHGHARSSSAPPTLPSLGPSPGARGGVWSTGLAERPALKKRCEVNAPKVGQGKQIQDLGLPPRLPGGRRTHTQILAKTDNYQKHMEDRPLPRGQDRGEETRRLQDRCAYNFGSALPTSAAPPGMPAPEPFQPSKARRCVTFAGLPDSRPGSARGCSLPPLAGRRGSGAEVAASGLSREHERMAQDIVQGVSEKQRELDSVEDALTSLTQHSEAVGEGTERRRVVRKQMVSASHKRLELKSAITKDMKDLETLLDLAPS